MKQNRWRRWLPVVVGIAAAGLLCGSGGVRVGLTAAAEQPAASSGIQPGEQDRWQTRSDYLYAIDGTVLRYAYTLGIENGEEHCVQFRGACDVQANIGHSEKVIVQIYIPELDLVVEKQELVAEGIGNTSSDVQATITNEVTYEGKTYETGVIVSASTEIKIGGQRLRPLSLTNS